MVKTPTIEQLTAAVTAAHRVHDVATAELERIGFEECAALDRRDEAAQVLRTARDDLDRALRSKS